MWEQLLTKAMQTMSNSAQSARDAEKIYSDHQNGSVHSTYPTNPTGEANAPTTSFTN